MSAFKTTRYFLNSIKTLIVVFLLSILPSSDAHSKNKTDSLQGVISNTLSKSEFDSCLLAKNYLALVENIGSTGDMQDGITVIAQAKSLNLKNCSYFSELLIYEGSFLSRLNLVDSSIHQLQLAIPYAYNKSLRGKLYFVLGTAQLMGRHSVSGAESLSKASKIFQIEKDTPRLISCYNNLANCLGLNGNYDSSIYYFKKSLKINKGKFLANSPKSASLCELGRIYNQLGQLDSAEYYYDLVIDHGDENFSFPGYAVVYQNIGKLKFEKGDYGQAELYLTKSLKRIKEAPGMDTYPNIYYLLSALAVKNNNTELANKYMARADTLYLMQLKSNRESTISEAEAKFKLSEKELKNKLLAKENEVASNTLSFQKLIIIIVLGAFTLSLILILFVWNQRKKVKRLNEKLDGHNEELKGLIDDKDNYMSLLAHDLRSPIASIVGLSDLILENTNSEVKEHTDDIRKSAVGSLQIMNEVLDIYRFETGQEKIEFELVELCEICRHIVRRYEPLASAKLQKLVISCESEVAIQSNSTLLKSILGNLISNAIKYNKAEGTCSIECSVHQKSVKLIIQDNGPGFSKIDRDKAFGKFQKLSAQPTGNESSSGLGLYMVQLMVNKIGGTIDLVETENKGATFIIDLPK